MSEELERLLLTVAEPARLDVIIMIIMTIVISLAMVMMVLMIMIEVVIVYLYDLEPIFMIHAQVFHGRGDSGIPGAFRQIHQRARAICGMAKHPGVI